MKQNVCDKSEDLLLLYYWCIPASCHFAFSSMQIFVFFIEDSLKIISDDSLKQS